MAMLINDKKPGVVVPVLSSNAMPSVARRYSPLQAIKAFAPIAWADLRVWSLAAILKTPALYFPFAWAGTLKERADL